MQGNMIRCLGESNSADNWMLFHDIDTDFDELTTYFEASKVGISHECKW